MHICQERIAAWSLLGVFLLGWIWCRAVASQPLVMPAASSTLPPKTTQRLATPLRTLLQHLPQQGAFGAQATASRALRFHPSGAVEVYIYTQPLEAAVLRTLAAHGARVLQSHVASGIVYALVPLEALETIAALPVVRWVASPSYARHRIGRVTSEGDVVMRAATARNRFNIDGSGVRIGIISDSLVNAQTSIISGDLPADVEIVNNADGAATGSTDEGRAMAEIVHDLAPGATLLFHSGFPTSLNMIAAVEALTAAGADIIVDDLGFFDEPVFEDGPVAQAVQRAIDNGVLYITAAGNEAGGYYRGVYREFAPNDGDPLLNLHDFGGGDTRLAVRVPAGRTFSVFLQWPNPFDGSANTADYDLLLVDGNGNTLDLSNDDQLNTMAPPLETAFFRNSGGQARTVGVVINRVAGESLPLTLHFVGAATLLEHAVERGSIFGHPCIRDALTVGAVDANDPGFNTVENFSSQGPCDIFVPGFEVRSKPDVVAADGVITTLNLFNPFVGTSAAAPHVAAIAALLMEAAGGPGVVSSTVIAHTLRLTAREIGTPDVDPSSGHGVVNAVLAVRAVRANANTPPQSIIDSPPEDITIAPNTRLDIQGQCIDAEDDRPFTFAWDFDGVAPPSTRRNPGRIAFRSIGTFMLSLTCTDATGLDDPTAAQRLVTVNTPPNSTITAPQSPLTLTVGERVNFSGTCSDAENHVPFMFFWQFGSAATPSTSTQQNPAHVRFTSPGTFTVTLTCSDSFGTPDGSPAGVRVTVLAAGGGGGGGGGGCTLVSTSSTRPGHLLSALGNILLPLIVIGIIRCWGGYDTWKKRRRRDHAASLSEGA